MGGTRTLWVGLAALAWSWLAANSSPKAAEATCAGSVLAAQEQPEAPCFTLEHDGLTRTYRLFVPPSDPADAWPRPLILLLHGALGSGGGLEAITRRAFNRLAEREGLVVAYPDGISGRWNVGTEPGAPDDVGFLRALIAAIGARVPIDRDTVFAAGLSNGGMMALRLACEASAQISAVSAVGASLPRPLAETCLPARPVGVQVIAGDRDPIVPYGGGTLRFMGRTWHDLLSVPDTAALFAGLYGCSAPLPVAAGDQAADGPTGLEILHYPCPRATVELVTVRGGGHTWPGGTQYLPELVIGVTRREADPSAMIWRFLSSFRAD